MKPIFEKIRPIVKEIEQYDAMLKKLLELRNFALSSRDIRHKVVYVDDKIMTIYYRDINFYKTELKRNKKHLKNAV